MGLSGGFPNESAEGRKVMASETSTVAVPEWTRAVVELAAREGVTDYLPRVWEMTRRVFPTAERIKVFTEDDPEIADDWHIVFGVQAPLTVEENVAAQWR